MSRPSRRELLRSLAAAAVAAASIDHVAAQEAHQHIIDEQSVSGGGPYRPKALTPHEYETLDRLTDLIIPAEGSAPGARAAGAAAWIDSLAAVNEQLKGIYTSGLAWMDRAMTTRGAKDFVTASEVQQKALLDQLAYKKRQTPELADGVQFFGWARRMTVDAFYTSKIGTDSLGYRGNTYLGEFKVPAEVMEYVNKRSPI
jgi:hypothetical protein